KKGGSNIMRTPIPIKIIKIFAYLLIILLFIVPFYIVIINAFKTNESVIKDPLFFAFSDLTMSNLVDVATSPSFDVLKAYGTTILITGFSILFTLFFCSMASYVIARHNNTFMILLYLFF